MSVPEPGYPTAVGTVSIGEAGRAAGDVVPRPDRRFPFHKGLVLDAAQIGDGLEIRAASLRGLAHQYYGTVRQDDFAYVVTDDDRWLVVAVADGVSAGSHSHLAAEVVCKSGCRRVAAALAETDPTDMDWRTHLTALAQDVTVRVGAALGLPGAGAAEVAERAAATALIAIVSVRPVEDGARTVHVVALGDTSAWLLHPGGDNPWHRLHAVKNLGAVFASSVTAAIPAMSHLLPTPVMVNLDRDGVLVLMTDGVGDPLGDGTGDVGRELAAVWRRPPDPLNFAAQVGFARRSFDDDRTVVAIWPGQAVS